MGILVHESLQRVRMYLVSLYSLTPEAIIRKNVETGPEYMGILRQEWMRLYRATFQRVQKGGDVVWDVAGVCRGCFRKRPLSSPHFCYSFPLSAGQSTAIPLSGAVVSAIPVSGAMAGAIERRMKTVIIILKISHSGISDQASGYFNKPGIPIC